MMEVNKRILLACAFKYALGSRSYVVSVVRKELEQAWNELPKGQQKNYHKEIKEAIAKREAGMDMDVIQWERILKLEVNG